MIELLLLAGICWAVARGWDASHQAVKRHTAARRKAVPDAHQRRAARQAWLGWWLGELLHGFPTNRHGLAAGWAEHRQAWEQHKIATAKRKAEHGEQRVTWQAEIAGYIHRMEVAAAKYAQGPSMSEQLRAAVAAILKRLNWTPPNGPEQQQPDRPDDRRKPDRRREEPPDDEPEDEEPPDEPPDDKQPEEPMAGSGADINYDQTLQTCEEAISAAEEGVNSEAITKVIALADGLGAMLRQDPDSTGQAAEAVTEANAVKEHASALIDVLTSLKSGVESKYGPQQEALDSAGVGQPEVGYLEH